MARAGRKRKEGRRDAKGKLRPIIMPDRGNDRTAAKFAAYGSDGADAIGRAYRSGLLGREEVGKPLLDAARKFKQAHRRSGVVVGDVQCPLNQDRGGVMYVDHDPESSRRREQRMFDSLWSAGSRASLSSNAFYGLVVSDHPDSGPGWLDRLILGGASEDDKERLDAAVEALKKIAA